MTEKEALHILLTGSTGYLGQHILKALLTASTEDLDARSVHIHAVYGSKSGLQIAIDSFVKEQETATNIQVTTHALDLTDAAAVSKLLERVQLDACLHTAAISSPKHCQEDPARAMQVNASEVFFQALKRHHPKILLVSLSTDQVYDGQQAPYLEDSSVLEPKNVYGTSKVALEQLSSRLFPQSSVVLRSSIILGPPAPFLSSAHETFVQFIASRQGQDTTFFTDEKRSVVFVNDVVATLLYFVRNSSTCTRGVYNMGGPDCWSRMELAQHVFSHLNLDPQHLIPAKKALHDQGPVVSPLNIGMNSSKLYQETGLHFKTLAEMLQLIFDRKC